MHFLCSTFGSSGDVFPMLGLALELRRRGHDVTFATNPQFEDAVRRNGLPFEPLGTKELYARSINSPDLWHPQRSFRHIFDILQTLLKRQYELHAEAAADRPTVAIANVFGFGALIAQDKLGIPVITVHCQPSVLWSDDVPPLMPGLFGPNWMKRIVFRVGERYFIDPVVCPFLNTWRTELGLPPVRKIARWWHSRFAVVCLFPEWFCPPQNDWPDNLIQTDFPLWDDRTDAGLSSAVEAFLSQGDPPLVFTPGSANIYGRRFFESAVAACDRLGRRGILLTQYPEQLPPDLPQTVAHFAYVPLTLLLPRAAAFIHHGGIGSTSQGLRAGIPQVIMPLAHDQFDNAARVAALRAGGALRPSRFTPKNLTRRLERLLTDPAVATACQTAAARLANPTGLSRAAEEIERNCPL